MIGLILETDDDAITVDETEIEQARWFSREEIRDILAGKHQEIFSPPPLAVAHHILKEWAQRS
ncbi:MAG: hypothetical protein CME88_02935 [Hirschia sp.]|nr:hypothetical protein [Hirschia sp.]MBF17316.1 hypothetical protein [Hirschia sp.]|tara:strand:+ start:88 stop:276 length:189 start_codon:yes stop_codon:yes gene_type:complete